MRTEYFMSQNGMEFKLQKLPYRQQQTIHWGRKETGNGRRKFFRMMKMYDSLDIRWVRHTGGPSFLEWKVYDLTRWRTLVKTQREHVQQTWNRQRASNTKNVVLIGSLPLSIYPRFALCHGASATRLLLVKPATRTVGPRTTWFYLLSYQNQTRGNQHFVVGVQVLGVLK